MPSASTGPTFRRRILKGERLCGTFLKTPTTRDAGILAKVGYEGVTAAFRTSPRHSTRK